MSSEQRWRDTIWAIVESSVLSGDDRFRETQWFVAGQMLSTASIGLKNGLNDGHITEVLRNTAEHTARTFGYDPSTVEGETFLAVYSRMRPEVIRAARRLRAEDRPG